MYRVAEGTSEIDLLENHNAGDLLGEAAFLTDSGNFVVPPAQLAADPCARALNHTTCRPKPLPGGAASAGTGGGGSPTETAAADCMSCVAAVWERGKGPAADAVRAQCSDPGPSFAYSPLAHSFHARRDRVVPLPPCSLYGAATLRPPPLGPDRGL